MNICDSDDGKDGRDGDDDNVFVIIDIIQVAQKQKELQARFKELEKQEQVWTISIYHVWNIGWKM